MTPEPHVCCKCKKEVVWTDCLPTICYLCSAKERELKNKDKADEPTVVLQNDIKSKP